MDKGKIIRLVCLTLGITAALTVAVVGLYMLWEKPPETAAQPEALTERQLHSPAPARPSPTATADRGTAFDTQRKDGIYTLLLVGNDDGTGNTDTIMLAKLDTVRHTADFVSIPRDTLINVDTPIRKINNVYWGARNRGEDGIGALTEHIRKLSGIEPDCYAVIDLDVFVQAVDILGGVWFDVPERLYYDRGPVIDLQPGEQLLNGEQAMGLCRYRSYVNGDLDRIEVQHDFLKAAASQLLSKGSVPNLTKLASLLADNMHTNMTASNMAWFARQLLMCGEEDINFYTAPNTPANFREISYTFLNLYDWLEMINEKLNPYSQVVTEGQLDLVYLHYGSVCCTTTLRGMDYFNSAEPVEENPEVYYDESEPEPQYTAPEPEAESAPEDFFWPGMDQGINMEIPDEDNWLSMY